MASPAWYCTVLYCTVLYVIWDLLIKIMCWNTLFFSPYSTDVLYCTVLCCTGIYWTVLVLLRYSMLWLTVFRRYHVLFVFVFIPSPMRVCTFLLEVSGTPIFDSYFYLPPQTSSWGSGTVVQEPRVNITPHHVGKNNGAAGSRWKRHNVQSLNIGQLCIHPEVKGVAGDFWLAAG